MSGDSQNLLKPTEALAADVRAKRVQELLKCLEQAGRGIHLIAKQLATGVPKGNELFYGVIVQGQINEVLFGLVELGQQDQPPEKPTPQLVTA